LTTRRLMRSRLLGMRGSGPRATSTWRMPRRAIPLGRVPILGGADGIAGGLIGGLARRTCVVSQCSTSVPWHANIARPDTTRYAVGAN
jgi:hypothetical protein